MWFVQRIPEQIPFIEWQITNGYGTFKKIIIIYYAFQNTNDIFSIYMSSEHEFEIITPDMIEWKLEKNSISLNLIYGQEI